MHPWYHISSVGRSKDELEVVGLRAELPWLFLSLPGCSPCLIQCLPILGINTILLHSPKDEFLEPHDSVLHPLPALGSRTTLFQYFHLEDPQRMGVQKQQQHRGREKL